MPLVIIRTTFPVNGAAVTDGSFSFGVALNRVASSYVLRLLHLSDPIETLCGSAGRINGAQAAA